MLEKRREEKEYKEEQSIPSRKEGDLEDVWEGRTSRMRLGAARSWMSKRDNCRRSYEMSKDCHFSPKKHRRVSKSPCSTQLQEVEKKKHDLMPEHQKVLKEVAEDTKHPGQKKKLAEGKCGSTRRDAGGKPMPREQVMVAWRPCGSSLSPWERMELRPLYKGSKGKWEWYTGRCQEEKKEGSVKMNKSKAESVSS